MAVAGRFALVLICVIGAGCGSTETRSTGEDLVKMHREAQAAFDSGEHARAEVLYKGLLRAMPNDAETWLRLGNLYARTDNAEQAVNAYLTALSLNGNDPRAWHNLGVVRIRQAWAAMLRANGLSGTGDPINGSSAETLRALEKLPYISNAGADARPAAGGGKPAPAVRPAESRP
jgi:tetratricopeptide (TPR) repeat protein